MRFGMNCAPPSPICIWTTALPADGALTWKWSCAPSSTRSDAACAPGRSDWDQSQTYGLSLYLPVHATIGWEVGAYPCRSSAVAGFCAEWDILDEKFPIEQARRCISE